MNTVSEFLYKIGEPMAGAILDENVNGVKKSVFYRYCNAYKKFWESMSLTPFNGELVYPCGLNCNHRARNTAVVPSFSFCIEDRRELLKSKTKDMPEAYQAVIDEIDRVQLPKTVHTVGGAGFTHSFINMRRILKEGLAGIKKRVDAVNDIDFREGLTLVLEGIDVYYNKVISELKGKEGSEELLKAYETVPYNPPKTLYEALVMWNFFYYIDGCDNIGPIDKELIKYYKGEDVTDIIHQIYMNVDANSGWSGTLGPDYNELTIQCIRAVRKTRRPNLQLMVKKDMPDEVWDEAVKSIADGNGQPALMNYHAYQEMLDKNFPYVPESDRNTLAFGGCTETMFCGLSNVGSDDGGIHTALVFGNFMREHLSDYSAFEDFYSDYKKLIRNEIKDMLEAVNEYKKARAQYRPHPVRTLLVEDCIAKELDYNNGGARYYFGVCNIAALITVVDSMLAVKELIFDKKLYPADEFISLMDSRDEKFLHEARECRCFGVNDDKADSLAADLTEWICDSYNAVDCYPCGKYYPVSNQFTTYEWAGMMVKATPDGRADYEPTSDSLGPVHGKDVKGPTAMLNSAAKLPLKRIIGTPVLNFRISRSNIAALRPLVEGFFSNGGVQIQVTCASREELLDALAHPEKHEDLIVRIGGYSERFNNLSSVLKQTVIDRTEY